MAKIELMIDIGSRNITVFKKDAGIVLKEPTIVASSTDSKKADFVAWGSEVKSRIAKGENLQIVYPIKAGVIEHMNGAIYLFKKVFENIAGTRHIIKPRITVLAGVSCGLENAEKHDIERALLDAGATSVTILESPIAVSQKFPGESTFVVDIGATKTEIAFVGPSGIVTGCSVDIGGDELNRMIVDHLVDTYRVEVPERSVEKLRIKIATMFDNDASSAIVNGKSIIDGKPKNVRVSSHELMQKMGVVFNKIAEVVNIVMSDAEAMSPKYSEDITNNGIYLCGGVANIAGLETYLSNILAVKVTRESEPENAVAMGGSTFFYNKDVLATMLNIKSFN